MAARDFRWTRFCVMSWAKTIVAKRILFDFSTTFRRRHLQKFWTLPYVMFSFISRTNCTSVLLRLLFLCIEWFVNKTPVVAFKCFNSISVVVMMFVCVLVVIVRVVVVVVLVIAGLTKFWFPFLSVCLKLDLRLNLPLLRSFLSGFPSFVSLLEKLSSCRCSQALACLSIHIERSSNPGNGLPLSTRCSLHFFFNDHGSLSRAIRTKKVEFKSAWKPCAFNVWTTFLRKEA